MIINMIRSQKPNKIIKKRKLSERSLRKSEYEDFVILKYM